MPRRPLPGCRYPGCPNVAMGGMGGYCEKHKGIYLKNKREASHKYDQYERGYDHSARYGANWRKIRESYIRTNPFCERCKEKGINTIAALVHHIKPLSDGGTNDINNLMSLCNQCHEEIHNEHGERFKK